MVKNRVLSQHEKRMIDFMLRDGVSQYRISRIMECSAGDVAEYAKRNRNRNRVDRDLVGAMVDVEGMTFDMVAKTLDIPHSRAQAAYWQYIGVKRERERNHKRLVARGFTGWR